MEGSWRGEGASESSLWDFLGDEEQMLCETADRPVVEVHFLCFRSDGNLLSSVFCRSNRGCRCSTLAGESLEA